MNLSDFLIPIGIYGGLLGYPLLQFWAIARMRGTWRVLSALPVFVMIPVLFATLSALYQGSNLWPILLIFIAPFALVYLSILLAIHRGVLNHRSTKH
jgi:hypothetical protein